MDAEIVGLVTGTVMGVTGFITGRISERRSFRLSAVAFASEYLRDLRTWASEAIDVLSEASTCVPGTAATEPLSEEGRHRCRYRLSALIDRGRLFLPNFHPDSQGIDKPLAYRGIRHPALDLLVGAEQVLSGQTHLVERFRSPRAAIVEVKREFVSELQGLLDPRSYNRHLALLLGEADVAPDGTSALARLAAGEHPDFSAEDDENLPREAR
jgi:hypothetical protein